MLFFGGFVLFCLVLSSPGLDVAGSRLPVGFASGAADLRMLFIFSGDTPKTTLCGVVLIFVFC
ncbi:hypothetical protein [Paraburkholderia sp. RL17-337-BIB-A]|uniref:hypothetical protein n=1 Tax=Paraburkholderia sp. RL17-337-BIB-A TaxID=3031636 RepID=UPI0038BD4BBD